MSLITLFPAETLAGHCQTLQAAHEHFMSGFYLLSCLSPHPANKAVIARQVCDLIQCLGTQATRQSVPRTEPVQPRRRPVSAWTIKAIEALTLANHPVSSAAGTAGKSPLARGFGPSSNSSAAAGS